MKRRNSLWTPRGWWEPRLSKQVSRRSLLKGTAVGAAGLAAVGLVGCGDDDDDDDDAAENGGNGGGDGGGELNISNWILYIDGETPEEAQTLIDFEAETGIDVNYTEDINANDEFFAVIQQPLSSGDDIGRDLIVLTYYMVPRLIRLGFLEELNKDNLPTVEANLRDDLRDPEYDPGRVYTVPWQSGMTGVAYNRALTGRDLTSVADVFDPEFAGRVTLLDDTRDTPSLVLLMQGINPEDATIEDIEGALNFVQEYVDNGHIRRFTGNDYVQDLVNGDIVAAFGWSGDIAYLSLDNPDLGFVLPEEGFHLWTDEAMVPAGAANQENAERFIDFVYDPNRAARLAAFINYVTPVAGAEDHIAEYDEALVDNQLIFPDEDTLSRAHTFADLDEDEERQLAEMFTALTGG